MKLYKTIRGLMLHHLGSYYEIQQHWDNVINRNALYDYLLAIAKKARKVSEQEAQTRIQFACLPPIGRQEVWAAGVTYLRSREARMDESKHSGGADLYDRVYDAERPELFFKSLPHRVAGPGDDVYIRRDSVWNVPEPELTIFMNSAGSIQGYTIGNDMSSRSIEGDNPLYLPQAKMYERSASLGPCLHVRNEMIPGDSRIEMTIERKNMEMFRDVTTVSRMKRTLPELAGYLYRETDFPDGSYLMTGTCLVPSNDFTLNEGDVVKITVDHIGTLTNQITFKPERLV